MSKIQFDVNVANSVAIDVANDVLSVKWMEVHPFRFNQSKSLSHSEIKSFIRNAFHEYNDLHIWDSFLSMEVYKFQNVCNFNCMIVNGSGKVGP